MSSFILMNGDKEITRFDCTGDWIDEDREWIRRRLHPYGRSNITRTLKSARLPDLESYLKVTRAISLNDTLWVNECENPTEWEKINPYKNKLSKVVSESVLLYNYTGGDFRKPSPEYQTSGMFDKCWRNIGDNIYLVKIGMERYTDIVGNEPYSEVLSYQVAKAMGMTNAVEYSIKEEYTSMLSKQSVGNCSLCRLFTSEECGFIPMEHTKFGKMYITDIYNHLESFDRRKLLEMLLLDSVILNIDRHYGNFGIMVDNSNFKYLGLAPIFDNNVALIPRISIRDRDKAELWGDIRDQHPKTMECSFIEQGKAAVNADRSLLNNLKRLKDFEFDILGMKHFSKNRADFLSRLVQYQARKIGELR